MNRCAPLLDLIAKHESNGDYNIVWSGIRPQDRPPKRLTRMTVGEVLAWQDSIDRQYMSEAAGRYQILEDTLRGLYREAGVSLSDKFDKATQDKLATQLLRRRGLDAFIAGTLSAHDFGNNLAKEWASLPVVSGPKRGRSHYAGDGLNRALTTPAQVLGVLDAIKSSPSPRPSPGFWAWIRRALNWIFTRHFRR